MSDPSNHELNGSADLYFDPDLSPEEHFQKLYRGVRNSKAALDTVDALAGAVRSLETRLEPVIAAHTRRTLLSQIARSAAVALGGLGGAAAGAIKLYEILKPH